MNLSGKGIVCDKIQVSINRRLLHGCNGGISPMRKYVIIAILSLLQACAVDQQFNVNVDSISKPKANTNTNTNYFLFSAVKDINEDDLQFQEYDSYVERALQLSGFRKAESSETAEIGIYLNYGIGDPETRVFTESVLQLSPMELPSMETGNKFNHYGGNSKGSNEKKHNPNTRESCKYSFNSGTWEKTSETCIKTETVYYCFMWLDAIDMNEYRKNRKKVQLWKTSVSTRGACDDLRISMPVLVTAAMPYIGSNTRKKIEVTLSESDSAFIHFKEIK